MMKILFYLLLLSVVLGYFDPTPIDYCNVTCGKWKIKSSACGCFKNGTRTEVIEGSIVTWREQMLELHNNFRDKFAGGSEEDKSYPKAANMHVLNYDMELEHIARCYLLTSFRNSHDKCRQASFCKGPDPGQNFCATGGLNFDWAYYVNDCFGDWVKEMDFIPENKRRSVLEKFSATADKEDRDYLHFTGLIWASIRKIGCVKMHNPKAEDIRFRFIFLCNYAGLRKMCAPNYPQKPIYQMGDPCSACGNETCNINTPGGKYQNLCGQMEPVPDDPPTYPWIPRTTTVDPTDFNNPDHPNYTGTLPIETTPSGPTKKRKGGANKTRLNSLIFFISSILSGKQLLLMK